MRLSEVPAELCLLLCPSGMESHKPDAHLLCPESPPWDLACVQASPTPLNRLGRCELKWVRGPVRLSLPTVSCFCPCCLLIVHLLPSCSQVPAPPIPASTMLHASSSVTHTEGMSSPTMSVNALGATWAHTARPVSVWVARTAAPGDGSRALALVMKLVLAVPVLELLLERPRV